jgi:hypothetical protein
MRNIIPVFFIGDRMDFSTSMNNTISRIMSNTISSNCLVKGGLPEVADYQTEMVTTAGFFSGGSPQTKCVLSLFFLIITAYSSQTSNKGDARY